MNPQSRFWSTLYEVVYKGYLLDLQCQRASTVERWTNIVVAITSTTSLGIWAIFKAYPLIWSGIIVVTQIVSVSSKYLPFSKRVQSSAACAHEFRRIQNWAEAKWCEISDGELTDQQINKARIELQGKTAKADKAHFPRGGLPQDNKLTDKATTQAEQYLNMHYGENTDGDDE